MIRAPRPTPSLNRPVRFARTPRRRTSPPPDIENEGDIGKFRTRTDWKGPNSWTDPKPQVSMGRRESSDRKSWEGSLPKSGSRLRWWYEALVGDIPAAVASRKNVGADWRSTGTLVAGDVYVDASRRTRNHRHSRHCARRFSSDPTPPRGSTVFRVYTRHLCVAREQNVIPLAILEGLWERDQINASRTRRGRREVVVGKEDEKADSKRGTRPNASAVASPRLRPLLCARGRCALRMAGR